jgi:acid phosphatase
MCVTGRKTKSHLISAARLFAGCAVVVVGCSGGGGGTAPPPPDGGTVGVVIGSYFRNARVCMDTNNNGVCDPGENSVLTGSNGQYSLQTAGGVVVAEIGTDAVEYDADTNATTPVSSRIVLRAPKEAPGVVSVHSTAVVSEMESGSLAYGSALQKVASALGVSATKLLSDFNKETDATAKAILRTASSDGLKRIQLALAAAKPTDDVRKILASATGTLDKINNIVIIYLENRSFDNLYGLFPGANGIANALVDPSRYRQVDRDGVTVLPRLPAVWTANAAQAAAWAFVATLPNQPFRIDAPSSGAPGLGLSVISPDLSHRFYNNRMQINGGKNDSFAAWSDAGGLAMGYYDGSLMKLWKLAQQYVLADNFFQGAFGGSYLNHFWFVCACSPDWSNPPASLISAVESSGTRLALAASSPASALAGPPAFVADLSVTPTLADGKNYSINTTQPSYQPSYTPPAGGGDPRLADPGGAGSTSLIPLPPLTTRTIGDALTIRGLDWKWYAGGWNRAVADRTTMLDGAFEPNHNPFLYFSRFDPTTTGGAAQRAAHLKDYTDLLADIQSGSLPPVAFYKPQSDLTQHPGDADITSGDEHVADLVAKLQASSQWKNMLIVVTYDENGGFWDHVAPPKADMWGPGTRIPAIIISPYAKKGYVDSVTYDTTSIIKLITRRFGLEPLPGVRQVVSDLSNSLDTSQ